MNLNFQHISEKKHTAIDKFSRRFYNSLNDINEAHEQNIDDFIDDRFNFVWMCSIKVNEKKNEQFLKDKYVKKSQKVARYLIILF